MTEGNNGTICEEDPEMCALKTQRLLSEAESLLKDIEEMLDWFTKTTPSRPKWHEVVFAKCCRRQSGGAELGMDPIWGRILAGDYGSQEELWEGQADIQEDGDTLVIEGLTFVDAASKQDLKRLSSQAGVE